ncbi:hypothetical protein N9J07_02785 [Bacteroidia bacterium]|nr:hypothetical protein [Bacteroidia bacterium]
MTKLDTATFIFFLIITCTSGCSEKEPTSSHCDRSVIVSDRNYNKANDNSDFSIEEVSITSNCMIITYNYGGGCGNINTSLVAGENTTQNTLNLPQRELKLSIDDNDNCKALIQTSEEFDISALQGEGNLTILKLHKWDTDINYTY